MRSAGMLGSSLQRLFEGLTPLDDRRATLPKRWPPHLLACQCHRLTAGAVQYMAGRSTGPVAARKEHRLIVGPDNELRGVAT